MAEPIALALVAVAGLFFILLGGASLAVPPLAGRFLLALAGSGPRHYAELALRFVFGSALVLAAPRMRFPGFFELFGWVLLCTTAVLLFVPWRWHRRFARHAVPGALRFLPFLGLSSLAMGGLVLWAVLPASAT